MVEKANVDFEGSRKEFWAFVGRRTTAKNRSIPSLKGVEGVSVTSTNGKLEVLQKHYQHLGRISVDSDFDDDWKEEVDSKVEACGRMSGLCEDAFLDKGIEKAQIPNDFKKLRNKTGGSDGLVGELLCVCFLLQYASKKRSFHFVR